MLTELLMPVPPWFGRNRRLHYYHYLWPACTILLLQEQWFHLQTPYASASFTLSLTGVELPAQTYQWQSSPDGVSFTTLPGQHLPLTMLYKQILLIIFVLLPASQLKFHCFASDHEYLFCVIAIPASSALCTSQTILIRYRLSAPRSIIPIPGCTSGNGSHIRFIGNRKYNGSSSTGGCLHSSVLQALRCYFCGLTTIVWLFEASEWTELPPSHTRYSGNRQHYHSI